MNRISLRRTVLTAGIVSLVAVPLAAGAAYAGTTKHHYQTPKHGHVTRTKGHGHVTTTKGHGRVTTTTKRPMTTLTTKVAHAEILNRATTVHSKVYATLHTVGSEVKVSCYVIGANVNGDKTWYRTTAPARGYIAGSDLTVASEPATGVAKCGAKR
jgi:hypothetical protein